MWVSMFSYVHTNIHFQGLINEDGVGTLVAPAGGSLLNYGNQYGGVYASQQHLQDVDVVEEEDPEIIEFSPGIFKFSLY